MACEVFDGTDMIGELFGEGQRVTDETGDALPQRIVEALDVIGCARSLADRPVLCRGNHPCVHHVSIGVKRGVLSVRFRNLGPQALRTPAAAIPDVQSNHLAARGIHGNPDPLLVGLLVHKAGHFIRFHRKPAEDDLPWGRDGLHMEMRRQGLKALDEKTQEPLEANPDGATNTPEREPFHQQALDQGPCLSRDAVWIEALDNLASAVLALMMLFAAVNVTMLLALLRSTGWTHRSHNQSALLPPRSPFVFVPTISWDREQSIPCITLPFLLLG